jgi:hypothetical protein
VESVPYHADPVSLVSRGVIVSLPLGSLELSRSTNPRRCAAAALGPKRRAPLVFGSQPTFEPRRVTRATRLGGVLP